MTHALTPLRAPSAHAARTGLTRAIVGEVVMGLAPGRSASEVFEVLRAAAFGLFVAAAAGLQQALAAVREGDTLVVPKLNRLARSVPTPERSATPYR